ncbi:hypothetical protein K469DRAFT_686004 [Zopfia rhizophila CBS 207.26]|uniref:Uncharacterized protein n=1 Tax=Zopfia rhizophila CBS 207.26 TaxID=1314779 RepID=A0A6A6D6G7_9PEZI|nr:hypothetical protein K469DRAFT_686004 [Zopfia rhizophila CBS 207.26]
MQLTARIRAPLQHLHVERISKIKKSHEVAMPTDVELQTLHDTGKLRIDASDSAELDEFHAFIREDMPAYTFGQTTAASMPKFNGCGGMLVGTDNEGNKIWACVVEKLYAHLFCDVPHRAWVIFVKVVDKRNTGGNLELQGVSAVDNIASWDANIIGGNSRERYNFVYDFLVAETSFSYDI